MKQTLKHVRKSSRKEQKVFTVSGEHQMVKFTWFWRGVVGKKVGIMGSGHSAESLGFVFSSVSTQGQEVPAAVILKSNTYWSC